MTTNQEVIEQADLDVGMFDPLTQATIRQHQIAAVKRASSEMQPLSQALQTMSPPISSGVPAARLNETTTFLTISVAEPRCGFCDGAGYYKEDVPYGHPHWGVIYPCACKLAERAARRKATVRDMLAQLDNGLGHLAGKSLMDFNLARPLDDLVEWCGITADLAQQRESLQRALEDAQRYLTAPNSGLFVCGPNGAGKSLLTAAILNSLVAHELTPASYESAPKLLRFIQSGFKDKSADDRLDALLDVELLLIDDLGSETRGSWNEQTLFEILDTRYKQQRRTLITSNLRRKDLAKRLASRIADMVDMEIWLVVSDLREIRLRERRQQYT